MRDGEDYIGRSSQELNAGAVAEFHGRISELEKQVADLQARLDQSQKRGDVEPYPGFMAHVVHVMQKYHAQDLPEVDPSAQTGA